MYVNHLRINQPGFQPPWTKEQLLAGLDKFYVTYGRFPTSHEIDSFAYLPSSRSIQRAYGGLVKLRSELLPGQITNFTTGAHRSAKAKATYANGRAYEKAYFEYLITQFKEIAVHEHKLIRPGDVSCDFFIYEKENRGTVLDIFYADSIINLINVINIKLKRYVLVEPETYLIVVGNPLIKQSDINIKVENRTFPLPSHVHIVTDEHFRNVIIPNLRNRSAYSL